MSTFHPDQSIHVSVTESFMLGIALLDREGCRPRAFGFPEQDFIKLANTLGFGFTADTYKSFFFNGPYGRIKVVQE